MMYRILIVDDNDDTREMLSRLLEMEGFHVIVAEDGREGLKLSALERPDLIMSDVSMPGLSGIDMVRLLRGKPEFMDIPIITITAYGARVQEEARQAGSDVALPKPVDIDILIMNIRSLLSSERFSFAEIA